MASVIKHLFKRFNRRAIELEVEEELRFHLELLGREHLQRGMSPEEAQAATRQRFGDLERIKNQCVEISSRSRPLMRALKSLSITIFLAGVLMRVFSADLYLRQVGDMLIAVAVLSRLLLYARGSRRSRLLSKNEMSSSLLFHHNSQTPVAAYHERQRTPVERVMSGE